MRARSMNEAMDKMIKPSVCMADLVSAVDSYVQKCGCVIKEFGGFLFLEHGIGLASYQHQEYCPPRLSRPSKTQPDEFSFNQG